MWHFNALGLRTKARLHVNKERTPSHLAVSRLTQFNGLDILLFLSLHIMLVLNNEWNFPSNVRLKAIDIQDDVAWKALHVYYIIFVLQWMSESESGNYMRLPLCDAIHLLLHGMNFMRYNKKKQHNHISTYLYLVCEQHPFECLNAMQHHHHHHRHCHTMGSCHTHTLTHAERRSMCQ